MRCLVHQPCLKSWGNSHGLLIKSGSKQITSVKMRPFSEFVIWLISMHFTWKEITENRQEVWFNHLMAPNLQVMLQKEGPKQFNCKEPSKANQKKHCSQNCQHCCEDYKSKDCQQKDRVCGDAKNDRGCAQSHKNHKLSWSAAKVFSLQSVNSIDSEIEGVLLLIMQV